MEKLSTVTTKHIHRSKKTHTEKYKFLLKCNLCASNDLSFVDYFLSRHVSESFIVKISRFQRNSSKTNKTSRFQKKQNCTLHKSAKSMEDEKDLTVWQT